MSCIVYPIARPGNNHRST